MSLILKQEAAVTIPSPAVGKSTLYVDSTTATLQLKQANGSINSFPPLGTSNTQVMFNDSNAIGGSTSFVYANGTNTLTVANLSVTGTLSAGDIVVSSISNGTSNVDIIGASGNVTTSVGGVANVLVITTTGANVLGTVSASGNITANGTVGNAIIGGGKTSGATQGTGIRGQGYVTASTDTAAAAGVRGYATDTHASGYNIGVLGNASGSGLGNYAFYVQGGGIGSIESTTFWDLFDNSATALVYQSTGKANILGLDTRDGAEGVYTSGYLNVTGNVTASRLISNIATGTAPLAVTSTTRVANLNVDYSNVADFINVTTQSSGNSYLLFANALTGNVTETANASFVANTSNGALYATTFVGALSGAATSATTAGTVTTNAQPNITSTGTLVSLSVSGNANIGNIGTAGLITATGNIQGGNLVTGGVLSATGNANAGNFNTAGQFVSTVATGTAPIVISSTTKVANLNVEQVDGFDASQSSLANTIVVRDANANISSNNFSTTGLITSTGNVTGANLITGGLITATGNLNAGNIITAGIVSATGNGTFGNVSATLHVGNLSGTGNSNVGNLGTTALVATGSGSFGANVNMNTFYINNVGTPSLSTDAATKGYVDGLASTGLYYHASVNAATTTTLATTTGGTITYNNGTSGVNANLVTTGSYTTVDGVNIASVGARILVKNEANAAWNGVYTYANSTTIVRSTDTDTYGTGAGDLSENDYFFVPAGTVNAGTSYVCNTAGTITFGTTNITFSLFSTSQVYSAGTGLTLTNTTFSVNASQTQITSVGTLTTLSVSGNANVGNIGATTFVGTLSGAATSATTAGTVTTAAQPNITSVGTLTSLGVSGTITTSTLTSNVATGTAPLTVTSTTLVPNLYVARANVSDYSAVTTATSGNYYVNFTNALTGNVQEYANAAFVANTSNGALYATTFVGALSGAATSATTAGTVTTNAQPNITSTGTLASLSVTANANIGNIGTGGLITATGNITGLNIISSTNHVFSVATGISAAGTVQGNATAITKDFNVVSTVAAGAGVILPVVAGLRMLVVNTSANALLVYPGTSGAINSLGTNIAYSLPAGGKLDFVSTTTAQWYTLNGTYA